MIDRSKALSAFESYVNSYDTSNINVRLKIDHTYRVAGFCKRIAKTLTDNSSDVDLAWLLGLLHDIGRFEQLKRYDTFFDKDSIDHAELGADILFSEGIIDQFISETALFPIIETSIRLHNKLVVPDGFDEKSMFFINVLRDADKCDIFRVLTEPPFDKRHDTIRNCPESARDLIMECIKEHRCVPRTFDMKPFEALLAQCCLAFELVYEESRVIVKEQGYLKHLMDTELPDQLKEQRDMLKKELEYFV